MSRLKKIYRSGMAGVLTFVFLFLTAFTSIAATGSISLTMINGNITFNVYQIGTLAFVNNQWEFTKNAAFDGVSFSLDDLDETNGIDDKRAKAIEIAGYIKANQGIAAYRTETSSAAGRVTFGTVDEGVYLIVKSDATAQNVLMDPFFVTIPTQSNDNTHYEWDINAEPKSESNIDKVTFNIKKISQSGSKPLSGAEFQLSYREAGSNGIWIPYESTLVTAGADGMISPQLPPEYWLYEFQLLETKAPSGYSKSRVGTIIFTMNEDGTIKDFTHTGGTDGYAAVSEDRTTIIVKNHTTGGNGGDPGDPGKPTPTSPGPGSSGDSDSTTDIDEGSTPLGNLINMIEDAVPLAGLVKTGDYAIPAAVLFGVMLLAGGGMGILVYRRKKNRSI